MIEKLKKQRNGLLWDESGDANLQAKRVIAHDKEIEAVEKDGTK